MVSYTHDYMRTLRNGNILKKESAVYWRAICLNTIRSERNDLPKKLTVINRYRYSENDTLTLESCRISFHPSSPQ